jgi:hypothetical protein
VGPLVSFKGKEMLLIQSQSIEEKEKKVLIILTQVVTSDGYILGIHRIPGTILTLIS